MSDTKGLIFVLLAFQMLLLLFVVLFPTYDFIVLQ